MSTCRIPYPYFRDQKLCTVLHWRGPTESNCRYISKGHSHLCIPRAASWYGWRDLNPHARRPRILSPLCLPFHHIHIIKTPCLFKAYKRVCCTGLKLLRSTAGVGFEPTHAESKSAELPLFYPAITCLRYRNTHHIRMLRSKNTQFAHMGYRHSTACSSRYGTHIHSQDH